MTDLLHLLARVIADQVRRQAQRKAGGSAPPAEIQPEEMVQDVAH